MYYCCGITEVGNRPHNEDAFLLEGKVRTEGSIVTALAEPFLMAVCDGVSGEQAGELASQTCLKLLSELEYSSRVIGFDGSFVLCRDQYYNCRCSRRLY